MRTNRLGSDLLTSVSPQKVVWGSQEAVGYLRSGKKDAVSRFASHGMVWVWAAPDQGKQHDVHSRGENACSVAFWVLSPLWRSTGPHHHPCLGLVSATQGHARVRDHSAACAHVPCRVSHMVLDQGRRPLGLFPCLCWTGGMGRQQDTPVVGHATECCAVHCRTSDGAC